MSNTSGDEESAGIKRTSITLPTDLAQWAAARAQGNTSAYIAGLIAKDRHQQAVAAELREFGYAGDMEITEAGRARARQTLDRAAARRAARTGRKAA